MANRNIDTEVWNDAKFTDDFTAEDKYFWLFLLTTRYGNLSGCFQITPNQIAKDMGYSKESAENLIYRFVHQHKLISYDARTQEVLIHNWYKYNWTISNKLEKPIYRFIDKIKSDDLRNMIIEMYESFKNGDRVSIGYQYPSNTNTISKPIPITISKTKEDSKDLNDSIKYIIDYLNNKLDTKYSYKTSKTRDLIKARLNEGKMIEDFVYVIDIKYDEWFNTDMEKYLRPETLFSNKFEGYRNQKKNANKQFKDFMDKEYEKTGELL